MRRKSVFRSMALSSLAIASMAGPTAGAAGDPARAAAPNVILDETCYLRRYCQFGVNRYSPAALKLEGERTLGKAGFDRLRRETERVLQKKGLDPAQVDWRDHVCQPMPENFAPPPAPPPPADWAGPSTAGQPGRAGCPDFDDSSWVRRRFPFQGGRPTDITSPGLGQFDESMDLGLQAAFHRARFWVDDPAAAGPLVLRLVSRQR